MAKNPYPAETRAADLYATAIGKGLDPETGRTYVERMLGAERKYQEQERAHQERERRLRQVRSEAQAKAHATGTYLLEDHRRGGVEALVERRQIELNREALRSAHRSGPLVESVREPEYRTVVIR